MRAQVHERSARRPQIQADFHILGVPALTGQGADVDDLGQRAMIARADGGLTRTPDAIHQCRFDSPGTYIIDDELDLSQTKLATATCTPASTANTHISIRTDLPAAGAIEGATGHGVEPHLAGGATVALAPRKARGIHNVCGRGRGRRWWRWRQIPAAIVLRSWRHGWLTRWRGWRW